MPTQKKNLKRKKTHQRFELSLPNAQAEQFAKVAKKEGTSVNRLIVELAQSYIDENYIVPKPLKKRLDEHNFLIRNMANNLNQIAHSSNIFHDAEKQNILKNLEQLNQTVATLVSDLSKP